MADRTLLTCRSNHIPDVSKKVDISKSNEEGEKHDSPGTVPNKECQRHQEEINKEEAYKKEIASLKFQNFKDRFVVKDIVKEVMKNIKEDVKPAQQSYYERDFSGLPYREHIER